MNPVYAHILIVHVPVVGALFTLAVMIAGAVIGDRKMTLLGCGFTVICAATAAVAYGTGPPAYETVAPTLSESTKELAEQHALLGRAAFIITLLTGVVALQVILRTAAAESPSPWVTRVLIALLVALAAILIWTAKLGGGIAHPHARLTSRSGESNLIAEFRPSVPHPAD